MTDNIKAIIGEKIRSQRLSLNITQEELAEMVGMHGKQIYRIETGKCSPSFINVLNIITALKMDIRVLDINNLNNFNPLKDEIYSILSDSTDEELYMYRNVIDAIRKSQRLTTKERQEIKKVTNSKQMELVSKHKN